MQFNDSASETGIVQEINTICQTNDNDFTLKQKARRVNQALDRFFYLALTSDDRWQFDDTNHTDFPIGTTDLVSGQQDYEFADDMLVITRVEILDQNNYWYKLFPIDQRDTDQGLEEFMTGGGLPIYYDKLAHSIFLYPVPNYNATAGLKVYYKRAGSAFIYTDTTKEPGIPSIFHTYIARYASLPFLIEKNKVYKNDVAALIGQDEEAIKEYFSKRANDEPLKMSTLYRNPR